MGNCIRVGRRLYELSCVLVALLAILATALPAQAEEKRPSLDELDLLGGAFGMLLLDNIWQGVDPYNVGQVLDDGTIGQHPVVLPEESLDKLEEMSSADLRYYQLRYNNARWAEIHSESPPMLDYRGDAGMEHLAKAYQSGLADWETILVLKPYLFRQFSREAHAGFEAIDKDLDPDDWPAEVAAVNARLDQQELAVLDAAIAAGPDQAWPYWEKGLYLTGRGEFESAVECIEAGNQAPNNIMPCLFPTCDAVDWVVEDWGGTNPVCEAVILEAIRHDNRRYWRIVRTERYKELIVAFNLGADRELMQPYFEMALLMASSKRARALDVRSSINVCQLLLNNILESQPGAYSPNQRLAILKAYDYCEDILLEFPVFGVLWSEWNPQSYAADTAHGSTTIRIPSRATGARPPASQELYDQLSESTDGVAYYTNYLEQVVNEYDLIRYNIQPALDKLLKLDLADPRWHRAQ